MKSAQINRYGDSEVLEINQTSTPSLNDPSEGKVLVRVKAAGVNPTGKFGKDSLRKWCLCSSLRPWEWIFQVL
jgi:hypothetical protein